MKARIPSLFLLTTLCCGFAQAQTPSFTTCNDFGHFDVTVGVSPPGSDGGVLIADSLNEFPKEGATGYTVVPADFGDFAGGDYETDDPGWIVPAGDLLGGEFLWFRALGTLRYWDKVDQRWLDEPPNGERVRYIGAIPLEVVLLGTQEEIDLYSNGTIWSGSSLQGPLEAPIEKAEAVAVGDALHAHLDFCLEDATSNCTDTGPGAIGSPSDGAYLIELQLFSDAVAANGLQQKYFDSEPVKVVLNNGLVANECGAAIGALVVPETVVDDSAPQPAAGVLIMTGP